MASPADRSPNVPNRFLLPAIAALAFAGACGSSTEPRVDVTPATITGTPTDTIRATVGSTVVTPLTVVVKNQAGRSIDSAIVTFAVTSGGGSVSSTSVHTDTAGRATTTWTLGPTAGVQSATATATGLTSVTFVAIAAAGAPATATKAAGDAQSAVAGATVATAPSVKVVDAFGNPLQNVLVTFAVASGSGAITGGLANTNASGIATVGSWQLGPSIGANTLTATAASLPALVFSATGTVGTASQVRITNTAPTLATGQTFKLTAQALDGNNNVIPTATITWSTSSASIATVDTAGTVKGAGAGNVTITAASGTGSATQVVSVVGHPAGTVIGAAQMNGNITGIVVNETTAFVSVSSSSAIGQVDLASATAGANTPVLAAPLDVAAGGGLVAAVTGGGTPEAWFVNTATQTRIDSVDLSFRPFRAAMNAAGTKLFVDRSDFNLLTIDVASAAITSTIQLAGTGTAMKIAAGDTLMYISTALGQVFEVDTRTSAIKRTLQPTTSVMDLSVSRDGKTLFTIDGSATVTMTALASGGLSGTVTFPASLNGIAISPDGQLLMGTMSGALFAAPFQDGTFQTAFTSSSIPLTGMFPTRVEFSPLGDFVAVVDAGGLKVVVLK